jgi:hypothetical protein
MDINLLYAVVALVTALSVASERLVDIVKSPVPYLNSKLSEENAEARRQGCVQLLAVFCGLVTSMLSFPITAQILKLESPYLFYGYWPAYGLNWLTVIALGVLASGGSSFWNSIQSYLKQVKDLKGFEAQKANPKGPPSPPT